MLDKGITSIVESKSGNTTDEDEEASEASSDPEDRLGNLPEVMPSLAENHTNHPSFDLFVHDLFGNNVETDELSIDTSRTIRLLDVKVRPKHPCILSYLRHDESTIGSDE